ncbi:hypothetical protein TgHK011_008587 [Trichoderma gracile]|nr:hypothetical protein TgHK011_008587 [Trichoderma gracile]
MYAVHTSTKHSSLGALVPERHREDGSEHRVIRKTASKSAMSIRPRRSRTIDGLGQGPSAKRAHVRNTSLQQQHEDRHGHACKTVADMTLANGLVKQTQSTSRGPKMIWPSKACALANLDSGDGQSAPRTTAADRGGQRSGLSNFMYGLYVPLHDSRICEDVHESRYIPALCGTPCIVALYVIE